MKVEDVMTRPVVAARADTDLADVARLMWDNDCGSVPVVDAEDKVVGMLTDRDLCMGAHFSGRSLRDLRASGCMSSQVVTCRADDSLETVARCMAEGRVRRIPVTDAGGRLQGLVSVGDLLGAAARASAGEGKAIHATLVTALTTICGRPGAGAVAAPLPAKPAAKSSKPRKKATTAKKPSASSRKPHRG